MTIISANGLSKQFDDALLFRDIAFGIEEGERVGLIGRNGVGKTTFLRVVAGVEVPDSGNVAYNSSLRFEYLEQLPDFMGTATALQTVMEGKKGVPALLAKHRELCHALERSSSAELTKELESVTAHIEAAHGWMLHNDAERLLLMLGMDRFHAPVSSLSGGLKKRVALARALLSSPDLLILDEPTNHLDADSVQWLQDYLQNSSKALLLVTHDRYFLDAVSTRIVELDHSKLYSYPGSYEKYLEHKATFTAIQDATAEHNRMKLKRELEWLQRGAKAQRKKQKSRVDWISTLANEEKLAEQRDIVIEVGNSFLGSKIIIARAISASINGQLLFKNFSYTAKPGDRIGIIGPNGSGKSTLLRALSGEYKPDSGEVDIGLTAKIGFFRQEITDLIEGSTLISSLREIAEYIDTGVGRDRFITAKELLERFLFPAKRHHSQVQTLSGGEKRRLSLLRLLMANPNVLLLDEPTNDFDLQTLSALEDYLDYFKGVLIIVSHDRAFLDRTVTTIFSFEEHGVIKEYPGNYSSYLEKKEERQKELSALLSVEKEREKTASAQAEKPKSDKQKLSYKEQKELATTEQRIAELEARQLELEAMLSSSSDYAVLQKAGDELAQLHDELDTAMLRWVELSERA